MKKILVAIDNSPRAPGVLAAASELAARLGAKMILFRAVTISEPLPEAWQAEETSYGDLLERQGREEVAALTRELEPKLVERVRVEIGVPWEVICKAAREEDVDCIVIGSHGYGTLERMLGTTAAKVVNHADRSVIVVRAGERLAA